MRDFKLFGPNKEYYGVQIEFHASLSWREIFIDKLNNGKWSMDILVCGEYVKDIIFDTLDEVIDSLVNTWYMDKSKIDEVRKECEKITNLISVSEKPAISKE